ncbi:MAG TPA: phosphonate C-P lyase system protein PhnG [Burkholderiaceae bacterium]|nr:phosphonate C-P lyase system protein PhnG [Burkholderiaceae bacterium]
MTMHGQIELAPDGSAEYPGVRQAWLALLARADIEELDQAFSRLAPPPRYEFLRPPESGMVMLRARIGGTGDPFHLGEASVTRCSVRIHGGHTGTGYVLGRQRRKAELVALFDALLMEPDNRSDLERSLLRPLRERLRDERAAGAQSSGTTKVEFFTMVRGD